MMSLAAIAGVLIIYPFKVWITQRGFGYWPTRIFTGGKTAIEEESMATLYLRNV